MIFDNIGLNIENIDELSESAATLVSKIFEESK